MEFQHELIIPNEGLPFKLFLFEGGNGNYVREKHWHTSVEIFAVMEGKLSFFLKEEEYPLKAGELIIINSNEIHSIHAPEKNQTVVLQIPLKQFEDYFTAERFIRFASTGHPRNRELAGRIRELYEVNKKQEICIQNITKNVTNFFSKLYSFCGLPKKQIIFYISLHLSFIQQVR